MLSIGLMSGTSMDGIDCALLETDGTPQLLVEHGFTSLTYDPRFSLLLKATEFAVKRYQGDLPKTKKNFTELIHSYFNLHQINISQVLSYFPTIKELSYDDMAKHSTELHIEIVNKLLQICHRRADQIDIVGYHGQTLFHQPHMKCSIMLGEPQYLADQLGIKVVYDFRRNDIDAGGQGAPFAPLFHQALAIRDNYLPLAVVNCGGISNITLISNEDENALIGFDTGPGNALIDTFVRTRTKGLQQMDRNGEYGLAGCVNEDMLTILFQKAIIKDGINYFLQSPPKSLDYGDMQLPSELDGLSLEEGCATLEAFTAYTIINSLSLVDCAVPKHWILAGGGWNNPVIRRELTQRLQQQYGKDIRVMTADEAKWNGQALEAQIFAYFAVRSLLNKPLSVPGTTRVPYPLSGGSLYTYMIANMPNP